MRTTHDLTRAAVWLALAACGAAGPPEPAHATEAAQPASSDRAEGTRVAGLLVHDGPDLSPTEEAYLLRLEHVLAAYESAPQPPHTYAENPGACLEWSYAVWAPHFAAVEAETVRVVQAHPRPGDETPAQRTFHVLLEVIELERSARALQMLAGGPPGYAGCPHDPPSHFARALTDLLAAAERCETSIAPDPGPLVATRAACSRYRAWAADLLAQATPPAPDECMEDMPEPGS